MKINKIIISITIIFFSCFFSSVAQEKSINRISKEQKLYELSIVWKELSYNFANMDNCQGVDLNSLYRLYISIIQDTRNDWEYCKAMQGFLAHFNNGHTDIYDIPYYLKHYLARPYLKTAYKDGKIVLENIAEKYGKDLHIGDEIVSINGIDALSYFKEFYVPYICTSNESDKIHKAMFNRGTAHLVQKNTKFTLEIKTDKGIKKINIYADKDIASVASAPKETWLVNDLAVSDDNIFVIDTLRSFAYIRSMACNQNFQDFFAEKYPLISTVDNVIIDLSQNRGGDNAFTHFAENALINQDTIYIYSMIGKVHNAYGKAYTSLVLYKQPEFDIAKYATAMYVRYYNGNVFEDIRYFTNYYDYVNVVEAQNRYKGNVYVIIGRNTASAGESFAVELSQSNNTVCLGSKTTGAMGNIYPIRLPSGLVIIMNVVKTYDFQGNDISSGFTPDYEYDFSEFYKTDNPNEMLSKFIKVIQEIEIEITK